MSRASRRILNTALTQLAAATGAPISLQDVHARAQNHALNTPFRAAEAAAASLIGCASIAREIARARGRTTATIELASRHAEASLLSFLYLKFADPDRAPAARIEPEGRTAAAGFFRTADDRWIYLHPGFPHNTKGLLDLLGTADDRDAVTGRIATRTAQDLEDSIADAGLCGAAVRAPDEWDRSVAGQLLRARPMVDVVQLGDSPPQPFPRDTGNPLTGIRVLDLTRILAGPTCARTLAAFGADVLRVGSADLPSIPLFVADTGFGKRSCHLDLRSSTGRETLLRLLGSTDVFSQGYRTGAMERLGLGVMDVAAARPGIIYVSINCYGHEGVWRARPGWEQLAQTVTGMAHVQGHHLRADTPMLLPAAVNDYSTGYLAALGTLAALQRRAVSGGSYWVRVSLARTGMWIRDLGLIRNPVARPLDAAEIERFSADMDSSWGRLRYLRPAASLAGADVGWTQPPEPLGSSPAEFA